MESSAQRPLYAASSLRTLSAEDGIAIGEIGPVCVVIWREAVIARRVQRLATAILQVVEQKGHGAGLFVVIEATCERPDDEQRQALIAIVASHEDKLKHMAVTIEATGFRAALVRSVLAGISLIDRRPGRRFHRVFGDVNAGAAFLRQHLELQADFLACVEDLRRQLAPPAAT
jgi:hypothetical protein